MSTDPLADDVLRDARRYRWLKQRNAFHLLQVAWGTDAGCKFRDVADLDAAVDAAMASTFAEALGQIPKE